MPQHRGVSRLTTEAAGRHATSCRHRSEHTRTTQERHEGEDTPSVCGGLAALLYHACVPITEATSRGLSHGRVRPCAIPTRRVCHSTATPRATACGRAPSPHHTCHSTGGDSMRVGPTRRLKWRATPTSHTATHWRSVIASLLRFAQPSRAHVLKRHTRVRRPVRSSPTRTRVGDHFPSLHRTTCAPSRCHFPMTGGPA